MEAVIMAAGLNQKLKMLYLVKILFEETDEHHGLSAQEIISRLEKCEVNVDRKTLYKDFDELDRFGLEVTSEQVGRNVLYHLITREFELPELKLLVDAVQSAKFITEKKSRQLIKKLESLASRHEAKYLHRQVLIAGRVKAVNEQIYYNVDILHEAINAGKQIQFHYSGWTVQKKLELKAHGKWFRVSPWHLMWDDENYYLIAVDHMDQLTKHYRVDKMLDISILDEEREGKEEFKSFDLARYTSSIFGMFGGEEINVTLEGEKYLVGALIDRFGKDITIIPTDDFHFIAHVNVVASRHFLGWIFSLGKDIRITAPESLVEQMKVEADRLREQYF